MGARSSATPDLLHNAETGLAFTGLVFIDPVATGYSASSRPATTCASGLYSVDGDVSAIAARDPAIVAGKIRSLLSPEFVAGESYAIRGTRSCATADQARASARARADHGLTPVDYANFRLQRSANMYRCEHGGGSAAEANGAVTTRRSRRRRTLRAGRGSPTFIKGQADKRRDDPPCRQGGCADRQ